MHCMTPISAPTLDNNVPNNSLHTQWEMVWIEIALATMDMQKYDVICRSFRHPALGTLKLNSFP